MTAQLTAAPAPAPLRPAQAAPQRPAPVPFWQRPGFNPWEGCAYTPWWAPRQAAR